VGVIEDKSGDFYRVNIRSGSLGSLSRLAFEGATKRNKPELKVGEPVYCRVLQAHSDLDTELTCVSASASTKKEWSSGEAVFGPLPQGLLLQVSLSFAKYLLQQENALLSALAKHFPFEVAVGVNGLVWLRASCAAEAVVLRSALVEADVRGFDDVQVQALAEVLARKHRHIDTSVK
jgi:exosome complex component RRP40